MGRRKGSLNKKTIEKNKRLSARKQKESANEQKQYPSLDDDKVQYELNDGQVVYQTKKPIAQQNAHTNSLPTKKSNYTPKKNDDKIEAILTAQGIIMPNAVDLEEAVLGAVMLEKNAYVQIADMIPDPEFFYDLKHQRVWEAIDILAHKNEPIDILTVTNTLKSIGALDAIGGPYFVAQLTSRVGSAANLEYHTRILTEKYIKRNIIKSSRLNEIDALNDDIDVFDLIDNAQNRIIKPVENVLNIKSTDGFPMFVEYMQMLQKVWEHDGKLMGITSGIPDLDDLIGGWQEPNLIIIAGRPGMGKTAAGITLLRNACGIQKKCGLFFSLEMSESEIIGRMNSIETGYPVKQLKSGKGIPKNIWRSLQSIPEIYRHNGKELLHINDTGGMTLQKIRIQAKRLKQSKGIDFIIIDFLQKIKHSSRKNGNKAEEVSDIANGLKDIAKELEIPVIALAQLNRETERGNNSKRPVLINLKESGGIEEAADIAVLLHRPDYYRKNGSEDHTVIKLDDGTEIDAEGRAIWDVAKHRDGPTGEIILNFDKKTTLFYQEGFKYDFVTPPTDDPQHVKNDENIEKVPDRYIKGDIFKSLKPKGNDRPTPTGTEQPPF